MQTFTEQFHVNEKTFWVVSQILFPVITYKMPKLPNNLRLECYYDLNKIKKY